jgi:monoamine oxidase
MLTIPNVTPVTLTRRRFIEELGLVGGTSLVMCAMTSWELMAGAAGQRPALSGRPAHGKVLVLGAGVSGLVIAYELGKLGYDYHVLEARDRVGGLAWTVRRGTDHTEIGGERQVCNFDAGLYVNVGAWRIPYTHTGVLNYCRELGVAIEIFINEAENAYFYYEGQEVGPLAGKRVRLREVKADMIGYTNELLVKALDQRQLDLPLTAEDKQRFLTYLVAQGYLDSSDRRYKAFAIRGPGTPHDFAALLRSGFSQRMRSVPATTGTTAAPMFQPVGGMDQFPKGFERAIGAARITFNAEVQSVHQSDTGVKVVCNDTRTGRRRELSADFVVVCLPLSVLPGVDINLSSELMAAAKSVTYSNSAKIGARDEAPLLGGGRSDLWRASLLQPSTGRVLVSIQRLLLAQRSVAGSLRQPACRRPARPPDQGTRRACADAREQSPSANPTGVRKCVRRVVAQCEVQPGWLCGRRHGCAPGATLDNRQPRHHRLRRNGARFVSRLDGRRGRRCLAGVEHAARACDARLNHVQSAQGAFSTARPVPETAAVINR